MPLAYTDREVLEWLVVGKHRLYHGPGGWRLGQNEIYPHCGKRLLERGLIEVAHQRVPTHQWGDTRGSTLYRISAVGRAALRDDAASTLGGTSAGAMPNLIDGSGRPAPRRHGPRPVRGLPAMSEGAARRDDVDHRGRARRNDPLERMLSESPEAYFGHYGGVGRTFVLTRPDGTAVTVQGWDLAEVPLQNGATLRLYVSSGPIFVVTHEPKHRYDLGSTRKILDVQVVRSGRELCALLSQTDPGRDLWSLAWSYPFVSVE